MKKIYKSLLGIALSIGVMTSVNAQTVVTIGVGTASTTGVNYNPIYRSSATSLFDFSRAYYLYTAAELTAAGVPSGATITKVEWDKSNAFGTVTTTANVVFNILMNNSSSTSYSVTLPWSTLSTGATPVYTNNTQVIPAVAGFIPFTLTSPFVYNGNSLEILTDWDCSAIPGNPTTGGFAFNTTVLANRTGGNSNSAALTGTTTMLTQGNRPNIRITFTPPPACSGLPAAGNVVASNTLLCSPQAVNLSLTGTSPVSGLTYQWLSSPNGISWAPIPTATNNTSAPTVTATTYYQCAVACGTNVAASSTLVVQFGTAPTAGASTVPSTVICTPQNVNISLTGASSLPGLTYQWLSSPTGSGYTSIPSATLSTTTQSVTGTIYYQALLTCGSGTALSTPVQVNIAVTTTNTVPYFEGFEGSVTPAFPNCSWLKTGDWLAQTGPSPTYNLAPQTGTKFAYTNWSTIPGGDILYSNGIQLNTGVTYFASVGYAVSPNSAPFDELNMLVGPNQSSVSAVSIASVAVVSNSVYATLSAAFTVPTSGLYYLGFKVSQPSSAPDHIGIDNISVTIPPTCTLAPVAGVITGTNTTNIGSTNAYTVSPATGNIQWFSGASATGPWNAIGGATLATGQNITAATAGTVYYTAIASTPGCPNDTANTALAVTVLFPGNDVCSPIALTTGTSSVYSLFGASVQAGEVAPPTDGSGIANNAWLQGTISSTMWFTFMAPASGNVSIKSPGFDSQLAVWSTTNCANLIGQATPTAPIGATLIAANDDDANYLANGVTQYSSIVKASCLTPGAMYYLQLDSYSQPATITSTTSIIITDLGAYNASFTGLASNYCLPAASSSLTSTNVGGVFTVGTSTTAVTSFTPASAGTFTVTYTNIPDACVTNSTTIVANTPTVTASSSSTLTCPGVPVTLTAATAATSYTWLPSGGNALTANVSPTTTTVYTVTVVDGACTGTASVTQNINVCIGLQTLTSNTASMYPNPNTGLVNITLSADLMNGSSVLIYDALGKLVLSQNLTNEVNAINTSKLEAGIYMFTITNNNQTVKVGRMIKQ